MTTEKRFAGVLETVKNARAQNQTEFILTGPSQAVLDRMKAEGLSWTEVGERGGRPRYLVKVPPLEPVVEPIPEEFKVP